MIVRIDNFERIVPVDQTNPRRKGGVPYEPLNGDRQAANAFNIIGQILVLLLAEIRTSDTAGQNEPMLILGCVGAASVIDTAEDDQCITSLDLGVHNAGIVVGGWGRTGVIPEVTPGDDPRRSIATVGLVARSEEREGPVPPQNVFFCLGVEALVDQIVSMETLSLGAWSQLQAGG